MLFFALSLTPAHAIDPIDLGGRNTARWLTRDTEAARFPADAATAAPGPVLTKGMEVELIVVEGDRARVRHTDRYGWVVIAALTDVAPARPATSGVPGGGLLTQPLLAPPKLDPPPDLGAGRGAGSR